MGIKASKNQLVKTTFDDLTLAIVLLTVISSKVLVSTACSEKHKKTVFVG